MPNVWVKDKKTKVQHSLPEALVDENFELLEGEPATNLDGSPRQPVYPKSLSSKSGDAASSGQSATTPKEK